MNLAIEVEGLTKWYGKLPALDDLHLAVKRGTAYGLLGANGAGKSTALECILGTRKADNGVISLLGMNPFSDRKILFQKVGVQFQDSHYPEKITVWELCEVTACLYRHAADPSDLLKKFGIWEMRRHAVSALSGGERQRLFVVLTLIPQPEIVFLDEVTTGLDAKARRDVWKILLELKEKGLTILMTSHFMDEVEAICDQIGILKRGKMVFQGTVAEAIGSSPYDTLEDAYLWYTQEEATE